MQLNPDKENIEVDPKTMELSQKEDKNLYFIVKLFEEFTNEYNDNQKTTSDLEG